MGTYYPPPASGGGGPETDPVFGAWNRSTGISITKSQVSDFGTYLTVETDPAFIASLTPYNAGNITGSTTLNYNNGKLQKVSLTGDITLNAPSNPVEGARLEVWLTASGADRDLSLNNIELPSDSGIGFPKTLTEGLTYIVLVRYIGGGVGWVLVSCVGGYEVPS
jgi:hypothetical protein